MWKRWINTVKDSLRNIGLDVRQPRKIVRGNAWGIAQEMNP